MTEPTDAYEIVNGWLVERGAYPVDYPAGPEWGPMPYSDAEPIVQLDTVPGWSTLVAEIKAEALRDVATHFIDWDVMHGHEETTDAIDVSHNTADYIMREANRIELEAKSDS